MPCTRIYIICYMFLANWSSKWNTNCGAFWWGCNSWQPEVVHLLACICPIDVTPIEMEPVSTKTTVINSGKDTVNTTAGSSPTTKGQVWLQYLQCRVDSMLDSQHNRSDVLLILITLLIILCSKETGYQLFLARQEFIHHVFLLLA